MSLSALKRELDLEFASRENKTNKSKKTTSKEANRGLSQGKTKKNRKTAPSNAKKKIKFHLSKEDYRREVDFTDECVKMLTELDNSVAKVDSTQKIRDQVAKAKRQAKTAQDYAKEGASFDTKRRHKMLPNGELAPLDGGSIFSEEDFAAVSKMHFVNSQKVVFKDD